MIFIPRALRISSHFSSEINKLIRYSIAIVVALAYISVIMCRQFTAHIGPHTKLIVKFWYRQSLNMCKVFLRTLRDEASSGPDGSTAELLFRGFVGCESSYT